MCRGISPAVLELDADVVAGVSAGADDGVPDVEMHRLDGSG